MKVIITVQHTQSIHHTNGMVGSWTDWALTDLGKEQAKNIANNLYKSFKDKNFVIFSSDLLRAKQTSEPLSNIFNTSPIYERALRERNIGKACGKSVEWLRENLEKEEVTIDDRIFSDAESRRDAWNRLKPFYDQLMNSDDEYIIIVSHGDILKLFNIMWLGLDITYLNNIELSGSSGGVSIFIEDENSKHIIRKFSDMSYIM